MAPPIVTVATAKKEKKEKKRRLSHSAPLRDLDEEEEDQPARKRARRSSTPMPVSTPLLAKPRDTDFTVQLIFDADSTPPVPDFTPFFVSTADKSLHCEKDKKHMMKKKKKKQQEADDSWMDMYPMSPRSEEDGDAMVIDPCTITEMAPVQDWLGDLDMGTLGLDFFVDEPSRVQAPPPPPASVAEEFDAEEVRRIQEDMELSMANDNYTTGGANVVEPEVDFFGLGV